MTQQGVTDLLALFNETYHRKYRNEVWAMLLDDVDDEAGMKAAVAICRTSKFPPTPAEVIARATGEEMSLSDRAILAWVVVAEEASSYRDSEWRELSPKDRNNATKLFLADLMYVWADKDDPAMERALVAVVDTVLNGSRNLLDARQAFVETYVATGRAIGDKMPSLDRYLKEARGEHEIGKCATYREVTTDYGITYREITTDKGVYYEDVDPTPTRAVGGGEP